MSFRDLEKRNTESPRHRVLERENSSYPPRKPDNSQRQLLRTTLESKAQPSRRSSQQEFHLENQYASPADPVSFSCSSLTPNDDDKEVLQRRRVQQREDDYAIQVMREREQELRDINRKMHVVNEIYKDLGEIVDRQQEQIDEIEEQVGNATDNTTKGLDQLERANKTRKRQKFETHIEQNNESGLQKQRHFLSLDFLRKGASDMVAKIGAAGKLVSLCGSGSASYVH